MQSRLSYVRWPTELGMKTGRGEVVDGVNVKSTPGVNRARRDSGADHASKTDLQARHRASCVAPYATRAMRMISPAISSGERIASIQPLAIALLGMSGCFAVSGF